MKNIQTLDGAIRAIDTKDNANLIIMADSGGIDLDNLEAALKAQAKHGALGESLAFLFLDETDVEIQLVMIEDKTNADWIKYYQAVYWFVCGFSDGEFYSVPCK